MINKDDELVVLCQVDEHRLKGEIKLDHVRKVIFDFVQVGPMYTSLLQMLKAKPFNDGTVEGDDEFD